MKQIFHNYKLWEDYQARMYDTPSPVGTKERVEKARECLSNPKLCNEYMQKVIDNWKYACEQVLSDKAMNRKAWLGWSACCLYADCKQEETCEAWWLLTEKERRKANSIARKHIINWEKSRCEFVQLQFELEVINEKRT